MISNSTFTYIWISSYPLFDSIQNRLRKFSISRIIVLDLNVKSSTIYYNMKIYNFIIPVASEKYNLSGFFG